MTASIESPANNLMADQALRLLTFLGATLMVAACSSHQQAPRVSGGGLPAMIISHDSKFNTDTAIMGNARVRISNADRGPLYEDFQKWARIFSTSDAVLLKVDEGVAYGAVLRVLDSALASGFRKFEFLHRIGTTDPDPSAFSALLQGWIKKRFFSTPSPGIIVDYYHPFNISVSARDAICFNSKEVNIEELRSRVAANTSRHTYLSAADMATFNKVLIVANTLRQSGLTDINLFLGKITYAGKQLPDRGRDCI